MRFRILGPLEIEGADGALLRRAKPRALLAYLLLHRNRPVSKAALIEALWGASPPASAPGALQNYVSQLRKSVGNALVTRAPGYMLETADDDVDAARFERLVANATSADPGERARLLDQAIALWRGPLLADVDEEFAEQERRRFDGLHEVAREDLLAAQLELGKDAELVPELERLVRDDPLRERPWELLMTALYRAGRQGDALAAFSEARRTLDEALGVEPTAALQQLQRRILTHDPTLAAPARSRVQVDGPDVTPRTDRRTVTVLFADVSGSTALGDVLEAESLRALMSSFFEEARAVVEGHGGTVEKFSGDEVLAVFGAPVTHEDDALRAVRAAADLLTAAQTIDEALAADRDGVTFRIRIGINTGEVVSGAASAGGTFVTGAPVITAKRLQELGSPSDIVIGPQTLGLVRDAVDVRPLGPQAIRGRDGHVEAFVVERVDPQAPGLARALDTPLLGRREEVARLLAAYEQARTESSCRLVLLLGEPGIGKTRVAREVVEQLEPAARILVGRCTSYGEGATYLPLVDALRDVQVELERVLAGDPEGEDVREQIAALVAGGRTRTSGDVAWAVRRALEALARERPLVAVFDDVHWGEPAFLDLLDYVSAWSRDAPILLLALARSELLEIRPGWAAAEGAIELLPLPPLADDDIGDLVARIGERLPTDARARITRLAEGFPLYAEHLVAYAADGEDEGEALPATLDALLASRLERLDEGERGTLERAAVIGREFWRGAVAALSPEEERPAVGRHLVSLVHKLFVQPARSELAREDALRFRHVLLRDVAYAGIPKGVRADLHERAARWLERRADEPDEVVGYHLEHAFRYRTELGPGDRAARTVGEDAGDRLGRAGIRALARSDIPAAQNLLARAAGVLPAGAPYRLELLAELGVAHHLAGQLENAVAAFQELLQEASRARDARWELRGRVELAIANVTKPPNGARDYLAVSSAAIPLFEAFGDDRALGRTWFTHGFAVGAFTGRYAEWEAAVERALEHYRRSGWSTSSCLQTLAAVLFYGPVHADTALRRLEELHDAANDRAGRAFVTLWRGALRALRGEFDAARADLRAADAVIAELGQSLTRAGAVAFAGSVIEQLAGDPVAAEAVLRRGAEALEAQQQLAALATRATELADVLYELGRLEEAGSWIETAREHSSEHDVVAQFGWRRVAAKLAAAAGDFATADELAAAAVALVDDTDGPNEQAIVRMDYATVAAARGDAAAATRWASEAVELFEAKGNAVSAARARAFGESVGTT